MTPATRRLLALGTLALILDSGTNALAGQALARIPMGDASISGRVTDRQTRRPIADAVITLTAISLMPSERKLGEAFLVTTTNADGHYAFDAIGTGSYQLKAAHPDYPDTVLISGETTKVSGGALFQVAAKQRSTNHDFTLVRAGFISGTITGHDGRPLSGATIRLVPLSGTAKYGTSAFGLAAKTDDRGQYTVTKVPEGQFHLSAAWTDMTGPGGTAATNPSIAYYPGAPSPREATAVDVGPGTHVRGIDMMIVAEPLLHLSGQVLRGAGEGPIEAELRRGGVERRTFRIADDGAFDLRLRPGRYVLLARTPGPDGMETASLTVDSSSDTTGVLLTLTAGGRISGRVVTDDGSAITDRLYVLAVLSDGKREIDLERRDRVEIDSLGAFELTGLAGVRVLRVVGLSEGWGVEQVLVGKNRVNSISLDESPSVDDVTIVLKRH